MSEPAHSYDDAGLDDIPKTLKAYAVKQIRALMLRGNLKPGDPLTETQLAELLGISRNPVREALIELESTGLIQTTVRARRVIGLNSAQLNLKANLQRLLELEAIQLAARRITGVDFCDIERLALRTTATGITQSAAVEHDLVFRRAVWAFADNVYLANILEDTTSCLLIHYSWMVAEGLFTPRPILSCGAVLQALRPYGKLTTSTFAGGE
jgi:DNA-binding GntR family transcriptional regulator